MSPLRIIAFWMCATALVTFPSPRAIADAPRFHFKPGEILTYQVENNTTVSETLDGKTTQTVSRLRLTKQWKCISIDDKGVATLHLSLTALRNEQVRPNGESLVFDSEDPKKTSPSMRGMSKFVGKVLAILRVAPSGEVVETKKTLTRFDSQLPFIVQLPAKELEEGSSWIRRFEIVLVPPLGTGEKYSARQLFRCADLQNGKATVSFKTQIVDLPKNPLDQVPLLAKQPSGAVVFNIESGFVERMELTIEREISGHQGKNSRYEFLSRFTEKRVGD